MAPGIAPGTYNIQRSDNLYLMVLGGVIDTGGTPYAWNVVKGPDEGVVYIQDPVTTNWLYDNGINSYLTKAIKDANAQWRDLSTDHSQNIHNVGTKKPLAIPYGAQGQEWQVNKAQAAA